jgi:hypothetical protein
VSFLLQAAIGWRPFGGHSIEQAAKVDRGQDKETVVKDPDRSNFR